MSGWAIAHSLHSLRGRRADGGTHNWSALSCRPGERQRKDLHGNLSSQLQWNVSGFPLSEHRGNHVVTCLRHIRVIRRFRTEQLAGRLTVRKGKKASETSLQ